MENAVSLGGLSNIITIELAKLGAVLEKALEDMDDTEIWAVFLRYCTDKRRRALVNSIIERKEAIAMAAQTILSISKNKAERDYYESLLKGELDYQANMVDARREGLAEGEQRERDKWQGVVADKDAEIARLRAQLGKR